jgi:hypothetical protein
MVTFWVGEISGSNAEKNQKGIMLSGEDFNHEFRLDI